MMVNKLFLKREHSQQMLPVVESRVSAQKGMISGVICTPFRQVLLNTAETLASFSISPGSLRENIVLSDFELHSLPSGTVLVIGEARIRLTFHCEPCFKISHLIKPAAIVHKRGYLGQVLNEATIRVGDPVSKEQELLEIIPYDPIERILWYLNKQASPVFASKLVWDIGLPASYCRALPAIIKKRKEIDPDKILFKSKRSQLLLFGEK